MRIITLAILVCLLSLPFSSLGQVSFDSTFGNNGIVVQDISGDRDYGTYSAIDPDGNIFVGGFYFDFVPSYHNNAFLSKYKPNGQLDSTFGDGGIIRFNLYSTNNGITGIDFQKDGKLIISIIEKQFRLLRLNHDGSIDTSFGNAGIATLVNNAVLNSGRDIKVFDNDAILLAGSFHNGESYKLILAKFTKEGLLDTSFGNQGKVIDQFDDKSTQIRAIKLQYDGKIVLAGEFYDQPDKPSGLLVRYLPDGLPDISFGFQGRVITQPEPTIYAVYNDVKTQSDGKIVVMGYSFEPAASRNQGLCARYTPNGQLDLTFGNNGFTYVKPAGNTIFYAGIIQSDDKILLAGGSGVGFPSFGTSALVCRLNPNGSLDNSFNTGGVILTNTDSTESNVYYSICLQRDNKIVPAGSFNKTSGQDGGDIAIVRFTNNLADGIGELQSLVFVSYPNPCVDLLTIENASEIKEITLLSSTGTKVMSRSFNSEDKIQLDVSELPVGSYILRIVTVNQLGYLKFIKR